MHDAMEALGYVTFGAIVVALAATTLFVREIPGIARYGRISSM